MIATVLDEPRYSRCQRSLITAGFEASNRKRMKIAFVQTHLTILQNIAFDFRDNSAPG